MTSLNPVLKVGRQVREALLVHEPSMSGEEARRRVIDMFQRVGIPEAEKRYDCYPHQLSGGLRQRRNSGLCAAGCRWFFRTPMPV